MRWTVLCLASVLGMSTTSAAVWAWTAPADPSPSGSSPLAVASTSPEGVGELARASTRGRFEAGTTLRVAGRLGHDSLPRSSTGETFVFLDLAAEEATASGAAVDLAIVLDRSGSMRGQKLDNAIAAAQGIVGRMRDGDTVSVVTYDDQSRVEVFPTRLDAVSRGQVLATLRTIGPGGHTCISCGLQSAMQLLQGSRNPVRHMLLLSDGEANVGVRDIDGFARLATDARTMGVPMTTVGVDVEYNERVMVALSRGSNGRHAFVARAGELPRVFDDIQSDIARTVASEAEVVLAPPPGVEIVEVFDRPSFRNGRDVVIPMGSFSANEHKTVLARVRVDASTVGERDIASVRLRYRDLVRNEQGDCEGELALAVTEGGEPTPLDPLVETRLAKVETIAALEEANALFARGETDAAQGLLARNRGRLRARRTTSAARAEAEARPAVANAFDEQLQAIESAEQGFEKAKANAPASPSGTFEGRASVRSNAAAADAFAQ